MSTQPRASVTLEFATAADRFRAAAFLAALAGAGVSFTAAEDIGPNISRTESVRVIVIWFN